MSRDYYWTQPSPGHATRLDVYVRRQGSENDVLLMPFKEPSFAEETAAEFNRRARNLAAFMWSA